MLILENDSVRKNFRSFVEDSGGGFELIGGGTRRAELVPKCDFSIDEFKEVRNQLFFSFKTEHHFLNIQSISRKRRITAVLIFGIIIFSS